MVEAGSASRRAILKAIAAAPVVRWSAVPTAPSQLASTDVSPLPKIEPPANLRRSREGRSASRFRYHNAESFFLSVERGIVQDGHDRLYQIGIVLQLGLSSHLFDVGFTDRWCAQNIGLYISRSLSFANATGFGFERPEFDLLAAILSPYSRWRYPAQGERTDDVPFTPAQLQALTRALLDHVHRVTGHPRPRGWNERHD